jgi:hypothetical protein
MKRPLLDIEELRRSIPTEIQWKEGVDPSKVDINEQIRLINELTRSAERMTALFVKHATRYHRENQ